MKKVFIVHGHKEEIRDQVSSFVRQIGLIPIILHEQSNRGRTIIEKFEEHSDVAFAVVLLTGDDKGGSNLVESVSWKPRARQNVILELGYFLGKLGRERVCVLYEPGVEIPSDYQGVLYVQIDERHSWMLQLEKEMRSAGLAVSSNKQD